MRSVANHSRSMLALVAAGVFAGNALAADVDQPGPRIHIVVIAGENALNRVDKQPQRPVIEVRDTNDRPVAGASVTFSVPAYGPGVEFVNGGRQATTYTDEFGRASAVTAWAIKPGTFEYRIAANFQGQSADATITQTNVDNPANTNSGAAPERHSSKRMLWFVLGGVAVAAGAGAAFAMHTSGSGTPSSTTTVTIGGTGSGGTVGGPH